MTKQDLERGNKLAEKMQELYDNISLLENALTIKERTIGRFAFSCREKNKIHIDGGAISFGGYLTVDRECMELILNFYKTKLAEANAEFESIGKGGE
jgi:hypothetical protein